MQHHALQVRELDDPGAVFEEMVQIMCDMVRVGLVHCDFNEFNVIISPTNTLTAIDFPQMVSVSHANGQALFERDLNCITRFFEKKMGYHVSPDVLPVWDDLLQQVVQGESLDVELHASGFNNDAGEGTCAIDGQRSIWHDSRRQGAEGPAGESAENDEDPGEGRSASQTSLSATCSSGPDDRCFQGLQIQGSGDLGPHVAVASKKASASVELENPADSGEDAHTSEDRDTASNGDRQVTDGAPSDQV